MTIELTDELQKIVDQKLETGEYDSATAVVAEALNALVERDRTLETIREGIADMEAGRTHPAEEVFEEIRQELGLKK